MTEQLLVHFSTTGPTADERLIREYVLDAVGRLPEHPSCERIGFVPAGHKSGVDGLVLLQISGDADAVVTSERDRWDTLVDEGLAADWKTEESDLVTHWGENGAERRTRFEMLAAQISTLIFEEFDTSPDPVDAYPAEADDRESPTGVGWWTVLHILTLQQAYSYGEEVDAYVEGIRDAVYHLVWYEGHEPATAKIDEVIESLETLHDELNRETDANE